MHVQNQFEDAARQPAGGGDDMRETRILAQKRQQIELRVSAGLRSPNDLWLEGQGYNFHRRCGLPVVNQNAVVEIRAEYNQIPLLDDKRSVLDLEICTSGIDVDYLRLFVPTCSHAAARGVDVKTDLDWEGRVREWESADPVGIDRRLD